MSRSSVRISCSKASRPANGWPRRPTARRRSSPANDRKSGFDAVIAQHPDMKIVASQTGNFNRVEGRQTAEALLQAHPEANVIYAHNDEMAIGAIAAIEAAGKKPGKDIIVVSIDGEM